MSLNLRKPGLPRHPCGAPDHAAGGKAQAGADCGGHRYGKAWVSRALKILLIFLGVLKQLMDYILGILTIKTPWQPMYPLAALKS